MSLSVALTTLPSPEVARAIATTLVNESLVACVNVISGVSSVYRWKGDLCVDDEALLVIKVPSANISKLEARLNELHPYETPEFIVIAPDQVGSKYLAWALGQDSSSNGS